MSKLLLSIFIYLKFYYLVPVVVDQKTISRNFDFGVVAVNANCK